MKPNDWGTIRDLVAGKYTGEFPIGLIVDSPWIPPYLGISTLDYITYPDIWLKANLEVIKRFPEVIFLPGFWAEMGMAAEPSGFGCKIQFYNNSPPNIRPFVSDLESAVDLDQPNPKTDGLMPLILNFYRKVEPKVKDAGYAIKMVAARGPMATASHLLGVTDFLMGVKLEPKLTHQLMKKMTRLTLDWLNAQVEVLFEVESIMLLDDLVGFLSPDDYLEFAHPYYTEICGSFPDLIKFFHNDMDNPVSFPYLKDWPVDVFNFSHKIPIEKVREMVGENMVLLGNIAPLDTLAKGTPEEVYENARSIIANHPQEKGLILSAGGGVSPGTPEENIRALIRAVKEK